MLSTLRDMQTTVAAADAAADALELRVKNMRVRASRGVDAFVGASTRVLHELHSGKVTALEDARAHAARTKRALQDAKHDVGAQESKLRAMQALVKSGRTSAFDMPDLTVRLPAHGGTGLQWAANVPTAAFAEFGRIVAPVNDLSGDVLANTVYYYGVSSNCVGVVLHGDFPVLSADDVEIVLEADDGAPLSALPLTLTHTRRGMCIEFSISADAASRDIRAQLRVHGVMLHAWTMRDGTQIDALRKCGCERALQTAPERVRLTALFGFSFATPNALTVPVERVSLLQQRLLCILQWYGVPHVPGAGLFTIEACLFTRHGQFIELSVRFATKTDFDTGADESMAVVSFPARQMDRREFAPDPRENPILRTAIIRLILAELALPEVADDLDALWNRLPQYLEMGARSTRTCQSGVHPGAKQQTDAESAVIASVDAYRRDAIRNPIPVRVAISTFLDVTAVESMVPNKARLKQFTAALNEIIYPFGLPRFPGTVANKYPPKHATDTYVDDKNIVFAAMALERLGVVTNCASQLSGMYPVMAAALAQVVRLERQLFQRANTFARRRANW